MKKLSTILSKLFDILLLAPAILPIFYLEDYLYPYLAPKTFVLRALGIVVVALFLHLFFSGRAFFWHRLREKTAYLPLILLIVAYITSALGFDFSHSFWSTFERGDGLLTLSVIVIFFYAILLSADRQWIFRLCKVVAVSATFTALYALLQWIELSAGVHIPLVREPNGRIGGTLGNAAFLASYLGMSVFASFVVARQTVTLWLRRLLYASVVFQIVVIFLSATRGTILALLAVAFLTLVYTAFGGNGKIRLAARGVFGAMVILLVVFFIFRSRLVNSPFEPVRRIASISRSDATVSSRIFLWRNLGAEALKKPITGYGAEHINIIYNKIYDPAVIGEQWFDRSHNAYLDYLLYYGIFGVLAYLGLIVLFVWRAFRLWRLGEKSGALFLLLACVYAVQNFFVFDTAMTLWLFFALLAGLAALRNEGQAGSFAMPRFVAGISTLVAIALLYFIYPVAIQPLRANKLLVEAYVYHLADVSRANELLQKGLSLNTYGDLEYGYQLYHMYTERQFTQLSGQNRIAAYNLAKEVLKKNFVRYGYDARTSLYLAHILDALPPGVSPDLELEKLAIEKTKQLSPKRKEPWYLEANIFLKQGDAAKTPAEKIRFYREGMAIIEKFAQMSPRFSDPRYILAQLSLTIGDGDRALSYANEGLVLFNGDEDSARKAARFYISTENWPRAVFFLDRVVSLNSDDYDAIYDLAKANFLAGNRDRAIELVNLLRKKKPGFVESDPNFLSALGV